MKKRWKIRLLSAVLLGACIAFYFVLEYMQCCCEELHTRLENSRALQRPIRYYAKHAVHDDLAEAIRTGSKSSCARLINLKSEQDKCKQRCTFTICSSREYSLHRCLEYVFYKHSGSVVFERIALRKLSKEEYDALAGGESKKGGKTEENPASANKNTDAIGVEMFLCECCCYSIPPQEPMLASIEPVFVGYKGVFESYTPQTRVISGIVASTGAMIDGIWLNIGQEILGYTLISVDRNSITLQKGNAKLTCSKTCEI